MKAALQDPLVLHRFPGIRDLVEDQPFVRQRNCLRVRLDRYLVPDSLVENNPVINPALEADV